jgi:hypothetical protein
MGLPTAPISTQRFLEVAKTITFKKGMPRQRMTYVPHPVSGRPPEVVRKYLEGNDPVSGKPILEELLAALTRPLDDEEKKTGFVTRPPRPRLIGPDTPANLERMMVENGWTDGLPVVLPTEARVAAMLKGTRRAPGEIVGLMRPSPPHEGWEYTVEMVAANAVMAGARPEHLPVILALASTGVTSLFSSTTSFARMVLVSGPIAREIRMNSGIGALGPFNEANAVIGRAWTLMSKNLGGSIAGETYMGSQGNNLNYNNVCFAENEAALPAGWKPFHVQKGFKPEESVVSTFTGWSLINHAGAAARNKEEFKRVIAGLSASGMGMGVGQAVILLDPIVARDLSESFDTKEKFSAWLIQSLAAPGRVPGMGAAMEIIVVGGEANPCLTIGDFSYISSAKVDPWR